MKLFEVDKVISFKFHIDLSLSENKRKEYSAKIIKNGGEVIPLPADDVLTLTTKKFRDGFSCEAYDIRFIDDCLEAETILDIGKYRLSGIHDYGCAMSLLLFGEKDCSVIEILRSRLSDTGISSPTNPSSRASPSTNSTQRVDPVEDCQLLRSLEPAEVIKTPKKKRQAEILENYSTPKKCRNGLTSPTVLKSLEKRGVSILRSSEKRNQKDIQFEDNSNLEIVKTNNEKKRVRINLSLPVNKDKGEIKQTLMRKESERIDEDEESQEVDVNTLVKQVTQDKKEKERRELERIEEETKEKERRKELERIEEERKEQEKRDELERKKQEKKEQERRESEKKKQEEMEQKRRKEQEKRDQEIREELCRKEMELKRLEEEMMEKLEREKLVYMKELERKEQELRKREKELEERIEQEKKTQEGKDESIERKKKDAPLITKVVKVVLDRTIDSLYSGDSSLKSQSPNETTSGKRCLSSFECDESLRELKRAKNKETKPQERGDSQSSVEKSSNLHETSDSAEISSLEMRPFTQVQPVSTQHSATDSVEVMFGSYEYQDEDIQNQAQFVNEKQLGSAEMDCEDSESCKIVGATQNLLDDLDSTVESLENNVQKLSGQENVDGSLEKMREIQERVENSQDLITEDESGPLLDDVSKAALLQDDSETDFESASDTPPNVKRNSDPDVIIVKAQENIEKSPMDIITVKRERDKSFENNEDDGDISDAETIKLSQFHARPDLIPKPTEKKKEVRQKKKGKMAELKKFLLGDSQELDNSFEDPRKQVMQENKNEEKENLGKSVPSGKKPVKNRWSALFSP